MKSYTESVYTLVKWIFILGGCVSFIGTIVFAFQIFAFEPSSADWADVLLSLVMAALAAAGAVLTSVVRRIHNAIVDR